jgi:DNA-binding HxlR family transcriptional regulator
VKKWDPFTRGCPSRQVLDRIGDKWTLLIFGALSDGPLRYSQIKSKLDGVSQKMLTQTLRGLERDGLVQRTIYPQIPPRVEYELTEAGENLDAPMAQLREWAATYTGAVLAAQERYDARLQEGLSDEPFYARERSAGRV